MSQDDICTSTPTSIVRGNGESIDVRTVDNASKWFKPYPVSETCLSFFLSFFLESLVFPRISTRGLKEKFFSSFLNSQLVRLQALTKLSALKKKLIISAQERPLPTSKCRKKIPKIFQLAVPSKSLNFPYHHSFFSL